jgi:putative oxidoreductase
MAVISKESPMHATLALAAARPWPAYAAHVGRWIFVAAFAMALFFKLTGIDETARFIGSEGFPVPMLLAWMAAAFEALLVFCLATRYYFRQAAVAAGIYVIFLAFAFHGPAHWSGNQVEFGFFVDHFTFLAGLLYAAAHDPGKRFGARHVAVNP